MDKRESLQQIFCSILKSANVYFDPPENIKMKYPAIKYNLSDIQNTYADNTVHMQAFAYDVTLIDEDQDSAFLKPISLLPHCRFGRHYVADNLHHFTFKLFF